MFPNLVNFAMLQTPGKDVDCYIGGNVGRWQGVVEANSLAVHPVSVELRLKVCLAPGAVRYNAQLELFDDRNDVGDRCSYKA